MKTIHRKLIDRLLLIAGLACVLAALVLWLKPGQKPQYNVLLITLDTTRADRLGAYGNNPSITPNLDVLAEKGVVFESAFCNVPLTLPSHASMLTGLLPPEHGLRLNSRGSLKDKVPMLSELFSQSGYRTAAFLAAPVLDARYGLDRGFDVYDDEIDIRTATGEHSDMMYRRGDIMAERSATWIKERGGNGRFFCWVHFFDPHYPYYTHSTIFGDKFEKASYDAEISFTDIQVGKLMKILEQNGLKDNTLVIVVGDHGESLQADPHFEPRPHHGYMLYHPTIHVPMILNLPRELKPGSRVAGPVSLVDLFPTIPAIAGIGPAPSSSGQNLLQVLKKQDRITGSVYAETLLPASFGWGRQRMVIADNWKYIESPVEELYNLAADPFETKNLAKEETGQLQELRQLLLSRADRMKIGETDKVKLTQEDARAIESLGYAGGGVEPDSELPDDLSEKKDIKNMLPLLRESERAQKLMQKQNFAEAMPIWDSILEKSPETMTFRVLHASTLMQTGKTKEAEQKLRKLLAETNEDPDKANMKHIVLNNLAYCLSQMGKYEEAMPYIKEALGRQPNQGTYHHTLATIFAGLGNKSKALLAARMAFRLDPANAEHLIYCARMEEENGNIDKAKQILEIVLEAKFPSHFKEEAKQLLNKL